MLVGYKSSSAAVRNETPDIGIYLYHWSVRTAADDELY